MGGFYRLAALLRSRYALWTKYTELRKVNGKGLISRRFISSDSGLPDRFAATWKPREHR